MKLLRTFGGAAALFVMGSSPALACSCSEQRVSFEEWSQHAPTLVTARVVSIGAPDREAWRRIQTHDVLGLEVVQMAKGSPLAERIKVWDADPVVLGDCGGGGLENIRVGTLLVVPLTSAREQRARMAAIWEMLRINPSDDDFILIRRMCGASFRILRH